jgi:hypothetical protein
MDLPIRRWRTVEFEFEFAGRWGCYVDWRSEVRSEWSASLPTPASLMPEAVNGTWSNVCTMVGERHARNIRRVRADMMNLWKLK